jgi:hypothetical protein
MGDFCKERRLDRTKKQAEPTTCPGTRHTHPPRLGQDPGPLGSVDPDDGGFLGDRAWWDPDLGAVLDQARASVLEFASAPDGRFEVIADAVTSAAREAYLNCARTAEAATDRHVSPLVEYEAAFAADVCSFPDLHDAVAREGACQEEGSILDEALDRYLHAVGARACDYRDAASVTGRPAELLELIEAVLDAVPQRMRAAATGNVPLILRQALRSRVTDEHQVAYLLATAEHESGFGTPRFPWTDEPLAEEGNRPHRRDDGTWAAHHHLRERAVVAQSEDELEVAYWDLAYGPGHHPEANAMGNAQATDGRDFRGRGFVQLTWKENYRRMGDVLNDEGTFQYLFDGVTYGGPDGEPVDLVAHPDHVSRSPELAAWVLVEGMRRGLFSASGDATLDSCIHGDDPDYRGARTLVNGGDRAEDIAVIARRYAAALSDVGTWSVLATSTVVPRPGVNDA